MSPLRLAAALAALSLAAVAAVGVVLATRGTNERPGLQVIAPATSSFPGPPPGAVVFARDQGPEVLALAVVAEGPRIVLQASVVDQQGKGVTGLRVTFTVQHGGDLVVRERAAPCGPGCYRADAAVARPQSVEVDVRGAGFLAAWPVRMPSTWPPPDASRLLARAAREWRRLRTLVVFDRLASDPRHVVKSRWKLVAPDRLSYEIEHGSSAVIIGKTRWDKVNGRWERSPTLPVRQPRPFWTSVTDAHVLGSTTLRGRPVWRVSFFDAKPHAWFQVAIDKQAFRTLDLLMVTNAHFMREVYGPFDAPIAIRPPA